MKTSNDSNEEFNDCMGLHPGMNPALLGGQNKAPGQNRVVRDQIYWKTVRNWKTDSKNWKTLRILEECNLIVIFVM